MASFISFLNDFQHFSSSFSQLLGDQYFIFGNSIGGGSQTVWYLSHHAIRQPSSTFTPGGCKAAIETVPSCFLTLTALCLSSSPLLILLCFAPRRISPAICQRIKERFYSQAHRSIRALPDTAVILNFNIFRPTSEPLILLIRCR